MSLDILLKPVGAGEQLPGNCWDSNNSATFANSVSWSSASNAEIPALGTDNWVIGGIFRLGLTSGNRFIWSCYLNATNFMGLRIVGATSAELILYLGGATSFSITIPLADIVRNCAQYYLAWRDGATVNLAFLDGQLKSTLSLAVGAGSAIGNDNFASISGNATSRFHYGSFNGTSNTSKFIGSIGLNYFAMLGSDTLTDIGLNTDAAKIALMRDPQRLFSVHGLATSQIVAYGNWTDSSNNPKRALGVSQFAAGDRLHCPFSSRYLTLAGGAAQAGEVMFPPYTVPASQDPIQIWRGSYNLLDLPPGFETPDGEGLVVYRSQKDQSHNAQFFIDFVKYGVGVNRWPYPVDARTQFIDSSASNAQGISWNGIIGVTGLGDTHTAMPLIPLYGSDGKVKAILASVYWHSGNRADIPAAGDRTLEIGQLVVIDDDGQTPMDIMGAPPWGSAYSGNEAAYTEGVNTYSLMINRAFKTMIATRSGAGGGSDLYEIMFDHATEQVEEYKHVISAGGDLRNYMGPAVIMSDGRMIRFALYIKTDSTTITGYCAYIVPIATDFTDNSKWFAPSGQRLDGTDTLPALGSIDLTNLALHITTDNDSFFPTLPANSVGMDVLYMEHPIHVNGPTFEGIAAVVRMSSDNGDASTVTTDSDGGSRIPYEACEIRRWTYTTGAAPTLTVRDSFNIQPLLATLLPQAWPRDTDFDAAEVAFTQCMQFGTNKMLMIVIDPLDVAVAANKVPPNIPTGHRLRGILFHDLSAADPTENVEFGEVLFEIANDNSEGFGLTPYFVGSGNDGSKSLAVFVGGGNWLAQGYPDREVYAVDLRNNWRTTLIENNKWPLPAASSLNNL